VTATRLPQLQRALVAAAEELERPEGVAIAPRPRPRRRAPAGRVLVIALLALLAAAAIGAAATGLLRSGSDVRPRSGKPPRPTTAYGVATGTVAAPLRVADPSGGPLAWGLRTFATTRGYGCVQLGRLQGDRLGVVGRDGAFGDDGRFHALGPQVLDRGSCVPLDEHGNAFLAVHAADVPGSAVPGLCGGGSRQPACGAAGHRSVDYGLLGPHAKSITYRTASGAARALAVTPGTGAYLIVGPPQEAKPISGPSGRGGRMTSDDSYLLAQTPASQTSLTVTYDDGTVCHVRHQLGSAGGCPAKGYVPLRVRRPTPAEVATTVSARITRDARGRGVLHVAFRARVAAHGARAAYVVEVHPQGGGCRTGVTGHPLERDVAAGQRVGAAIELGGPPCANGYRVALDYRIASRRPIWGEGLHDPGTPVGSAMAGPR
jgi:hypothetical protein